MLNINTKNIAALVGSGLLAMIPTGLLAQKAVAAEQFQPNISEGIDANEIAQVYIIDNEAIAVGDLQDGPEAYVSPSDDTISLTVVNESNSQIQYLLPNSEYRTLQPGERVTLNNWELPNQIGIQQFDGGLTEVDRIAVSNNGESATVYLTYSPSFARSITGLSFFENGAIYIAS
jgi:hypothetical protein